jgi:hypothetical protein
MTTKHNSLAALLLTCWRLDFANSNRERALVTILTIFGGSAYFLEQVGKCSRPTSRGNQALFKDRIAFGVVLLGYSGGLDHL